MKNTLILLIFLAACTLQGVDQTDAVDASSDSSVSSDITETGPGDTATDTATVSDSASDTDIAAVCPSNNPAFAQTESGCVQGYLEQGIRTFKGIPYAAPPVGDLRWRAPQPAGSWQGVRYAKGFSPTCIQFMNGLSAGLDKGTGSEDCLYLNIWSPVTTDSRKLPVMFFIHGGSDAFGSASEPVYNARHLSKKGVVVVTINYRLGLLGFMGDKYLTAEDPNKTSGNYGMLDIIAALKWVKANISNFNGDPTHITVFGESAGAIDTCLLLFSPLAKDLFSNAIMESGSCLFINDDQKASDAVGTRVEKLLNCDGTPDVAACMRSKATDELVMAGDKIYSNELTGLYPHVDGYFLTETPKLALANGHVPTLPVIAGTNRDEATAFTYAMNIDTENDYNLLMAQYGMIGGFSKDDLIKHYPVANYKNYRDAFNHFMTDVLFVCPTRKFLRDVSKAGGSAYQYEFTYEYPGSTLGVTHGAELFYVFGSYSQPVIPDIETVSNAFISYWTRFAAMSNPNNTGLTNWPAYDKTTNPYLILDKTITTGQDFRSAECDFLDTGNAY